MNVVFRHMKFGSIDLLINNWIPNDKPFFYISYILIRKNASLLWSFTMLEIYDFLIYEKIIMFPFFGFIFFFTESESCSLVSNSLQPHGLHSPWNSPGQNTGVGSLSLLQGIFPTQRSNPGILHCRQILYQLSYQGSPIILGRSKHNSSPGSLWGLCYRGLQPWGDFSSQWIVLKPPAVPAEWWWGVAVTGSFLGHV